MDRRRWVKKLQWINLYPSIQQTKVWPYNPREIHYLEELGADGRIVLKPIFSIERGRRLDSFRSRQEIWWTLVNAAMNTWFPYKAGIFLTSWAIITFSRSTLPHGVSYPSIFMEEIQIAGLWAGLRTWDIRIPNRNTNHTSITFDNKAVRPCLY